MAYDKTTWVNDVTAVSANNMNHIENGIKDAHDILDNIFNAIYPVGSIYMSASLSTHEQVEALFGGTWEAWGSGRVPVGVDTSQTEFDTVEETGGAKTVKLTAAQSGIRAHTHTTGDSTNNRFLAINSSKNIYRQNVGSPSTAATATIWQNMVQAEATIGKLSSTGSTLEDYAEQAHNNLQPYITCYMYKRIA